MCLLLALYAAYLFGGVSGRDYVCARIIFALFAAWMLFGVYRALVKAFQKPRREIYPTFNGVKYNGVPVSAWKIAGDFLNPLKMKFFTMGILFFLGSLCAGMLLINPHLENVFFLVLVITVAIKTAVLIRLLKFNSLSNRLGKDITELNGDIGVSRYNVTEELIDYPHVTPRMIIDPLRPYVNLFGSESDYKNNMAQFTQEQRNILAIVWYIDVVYAEGHYAFFAGQYGRVYPDTIRALRAIGAEHHAIILESAVSEFTDAYTPMTDRIARIEKIDSLNLDLEDADEALEALDIDGSEINSLAMKYIRGHKESFLFTVQN